MVSKKSPLSQKLKLSFKNHSLVVIAVVLCFVLSLTFTFKDTWGSTAYDSTSSYLTAGLFALSPPIDAYDCWNKATACKAGQDCDSQYIGQLYFCSANGCTYPDEGTSAKGESSRLSFPERYEIDGICRESDGSEKPPWDPGCAMQYDPVCGEDGIDYQSSCHANEAGQNNYTHGECQSATSVTKPDFYNPPEDGCWHKVSGGQYEGRMYHCNDNGCDYPDGTWCTDKGCYDANNQMTNDDFWSKEESSIDKECRNADGSPKYDDHPDECEDRWDPVCGDDGVTYEDDCHAHQAGIYNYVQGQCTGTPSSTECSEERYPVCANGVTYHNDCIARESGITNFSLGECNEPIPQPIPDPDSEPEPKPNWVNHTWTYQGGETKNSYILNRTDQEYSSYIAEIDELCRMTSYFNSGWESNAGDDNPENWRNFGIPICSGPSVCPTVYDPVCGEDGRTYSNECSMNNSETTIAYRGECTEGPIADCDYNDYTPVCGVDGRTYVNECDAYQSRVDIVFHGECQGTSSDDDDNALREKERWHKDKFRELNNFRNFDIKTQGASNLLDQFKDLLTKMRTAFNKNEQKNYQNHNDELETIRIQIDWEFSTLYFQQRLNDAGRTLKDMKRQLKDYLRDAQNDNGNFFQKMIDKFTRVLGEIRQAYFDAIAVDGGPTQAMERRFDDELNFISQDFFDAINQAWQNINQKNEKEDMKRIYTEKIRFIKDKERIIKELKRENIDVSRLEFILEKMEPLLNLMEKLTKSSGFDMRDFWDLNADIDDLDRDFWDLQEELNKSRWEDEEQKNTLRNLEDKERMLIRDMQEECERNSCDAAQQKILKSLKDILGKMKIMRDQKEYEEFWDYDWQFNDLQREFWETMDHTRKQFDIGRWLKDIARGIKDQGRWVRDLLREAKDGIIQSSQVSQMESLLKKMETVASLANDLFQAGKYEDANDLLEGEYRDVEQEFHDIGQSLNNDRERQFFKEELSHIQEEINRIKQNIQASTINGEISQERADQCLRYVTQGQKFLDQLKDIYSRNERSDLAQEVRERFQDIEHRATSQCGDLFDRTPDYITFNDHYIEDEHQDDARGIFEQMSQDLVLKVMEDLTNNSEFINEILSTVKEEFHKNISDTLEATAFIPQKFHDELLSHKAEMLRLTQEVEDLKSEIQLARTELDQLTEIQNEMANYNFVGSSGTQIEEDLQEFITRANTLSPTQVKAELKSLKKKASEAIDQSRNEKFERGIIPFKDTDDHQWFTRFVKNVSEKGVVNGYRDGSGRLTGEYGPSNPVTVAESMKMSFEALGLGPAAGTPRNVAAKNHWAKGYFKQAEDLGISIVSEINNLDRPATRAEVIALTIEAQGINPTARTAPFTDVPTSHQHAGVINEAKSIGLITGDEGKGTFRPDGQINRAEAAKVFDKAGDLVTEPLQL